MVYNSPTQIAALDKQTHSGCCGDVLSMAAKAPTITWTHPESYPPSSLKKHPSRSKISQTLPPRSEISQQERWWILPRLSYVWPERVRNSESGWRMMGRQWYFPDAFFIPFHPRNTLVSVAWSKNSTPPTRIDSLEDGKYCAGKRLLCVSVCFQHVFQHALLRIPFSSQFVHHLRGGTNRETQRESRSLMSFVSFRVHH